MQRENSAMEATSAYRPQKSMRCCGFSRGMEVNKAKECKQRIRLMIGIRIPSINGQKASVISSRTFLRKPHLRMRNGHREWTEKNSSYSSRKLCSISRAGCGRSVMLRVRLKPLAGEKSFSTISPMQKEIRRWLHGKWPFFAETIRRIFRGRGKISTTPYSLRKKEVTKSVRFSTSSTYGRWKSWKPK